ncbi:NfeD family protein [Eubacterium aggregans]|uniref:NfeD family protein n=1 Tax=Eubacterium aggregans TaxID=81409 RepID=UPI003F676ABE
MGQKGIVTEAIDNAISQGQVKVDGALWSTRSEDGQPIAENTVVVVRRLDGIKAIVKRKEQ